MFTERDRSEKIIVQVQRGAQTIQVVLSSRKLSYINGLMLQEESCQVLCHSLQYQKGSCDFSRLLNICGLGDTSDSKRCSGHSSCFWGNFLVCSAETEKMGFGRFSRSFHLSYGLAPGLCRDEIIPFFDQGSLSWGCWYLQLMPLLDSRELSRERGNGPIRNWCSERSINHVRNKFWGWINFFVYPSAIIGTCRRMLRLIWTDQPPVQPEVWKKRDYDSTQLGP